MNSKAAPKKRTGKQIHPVRTYFQSKTEARAKEAFEKKRLGEEKRLSTREELTQLLYDFVKRKRAELTGNGIGISEERAVEMLERRHAKIICREFSLEPTNKE